MNSKLVITVDLDDWYHVGWLAGRRRTIFHSSQEARTEYSGEGLRGPTHRILNLFDEYSVNTTFFIQGEVAQEYPDLVELIKARGHEIGSHDMHHVSPRIRSIEEFREDVTQSKQVLEGLLKEQILGYRSPNAELLAENVNIIEDLGFRYDASVFPCIPIPGFYGRPLAPTQPYRPSREDLSRAVRDRDFIEFPFAVVSYLRIPGGSSWYLRNLGLGIVKLAIRSQLRRGYACFNFHPWEISDNVPRVPGLPAHVLRNVGTETFSRIRALLEAFKSLSKFVCFRDCLDDLGSDR